MKPPEFTGERYIPGQGGAQLAYEHLHRYLFALRWAKGKKVLDLASGSGYGAALLAQTASQVWALELDRQSVEYARRTCGRSNLIFVQADVTSLPFESASFGLVVALEILEHVQDSRALVREITRVVHPGGLALISTPDKARYSDARNYSNPFHVREFYREEFAALLGEYFQTFELMGQQVRAGSLIVAEKPAALEEEVISSHLPDPTRTAVDSMYLLALCRREPAPDGVPALSSYVDLSDYLFEEWRDREQSLLREISTLDSELEKRGIWGTQLAETIRDRDDTLDRVLAEVGERDQTIRELQDELRTEVSKRDQALIELRRDFDDRTRWVQEVETQLHDRDRRLSETMQELNAVAARLALIRHSTLYRALCRLGLLPR
jgi:SAM-dependent methyltransferase